MNKQKGFMLVEGLIIAIIVGIVGFSAWYVWSSRNEDENLAVSDSNDSNIVNNSEQIFTKKLTDDYMKGLRDCNFDIYINAKLDLFKYEGSLPNDIVLDKEKTKFDQGCGLITSYEHLNSIVVEDGVLIAHFYNISSENVQYKERPIVSLWASGDEEDGYLLNGAPYSPMTLQSYEEIVNN